MYVVLCLFHCSVAFKCPSIPLRLASRLLRSQTFVFCSQPFLAEVPLEFCVLGGFPVTLAASLTSPSLSSQLCLRFTTWAQATQAGPWSSDISNSVCVALSGHRRELGLGHCFYARLGGWTCQMQPNFLLPQIAFSCESICLVAIDLQLLPQFRKKVFSQSLVHLCFQEACESLSFLVYHVHGDAILQTLCLSIFCWLTICKSIHF